jgi:SAM-dependent methyltransferase
VALATAGRWRRGLLLAGFPVSVLAAGLGQDLPPWAWLVALAPLLAAYPIKAWRDAPFFPSPPQALTGLALRLAPAARLLDAGCGAGHGLAAMRHAWPHANCEGIEWSWPLAALCKLRCPWARVRRGDLWAETWRAYDLVYLFQRPESMARAWAKACAEMRAGSWLVSLEFAVPGVRPDLSAREPGGRCVLAYRLGPSANSTRAGACR